MTGKLEWEGRVGAEWADKADALDRLLGPSGDEALAALAAQGVGAGARALDLGCGAGATSFALAARVAPGGEVWGVDVSPDLLARARARQHERQRERQRERQAEEGADAVRFVLADAAVWLAPAPMDALYSRCGAMFFDTPPAAWRHLHAQMAPGAPLAIACWRAPARNEWVSLPMRLADDLVAPAPPPAAGAPGPFAWADDAAVLALLRGAGWRDVRATAYDHRVPIGAGTDPDPIARAVLFACRIGPLASRIAALAPEARAAVRARLAAGFDAHLEDGAVRVPASAWIIEARA
jgi:SAM-dependent methyltransferase